jgi:general nucleoside transport system permease protein
LPNNALAPAVGFLAATIRLSTPLLLAASGELVAERAGVLNLGVEGMMLNGALFGFLGAYFSGSLLVGWLSGMLAGALLALLFAFFTVSLRSHQVIVALGINLLALGETSFLYREIFGLAAITPQIKAALPRAIPLMSRIPILGPVFFDQALLTYVAFALPPLVWIFLYKTPAGRALRAVGENAIAADAVGVDVRRIRYLAVIFGGLLAGLSGAYLSTVALNLFLENMTGGAGWIAVAIVIFGNWNPWGILLAALTFGGAEALELRLQSAGIGIPREFIVMLPYLLTLVALSGFVKRSKAPAQLCIPFARNYKI